MQPAQQQQQQLQSRINITELKAQIVRKVGPEPSKRYFYYLNRLLSQKLSKSEFDKLCFWTLGRENLPLHNQLIRSILRNACQSKVPPPPIHEKEAIIITKTSSKLGKKSPPIEDGYHHHQQNGPSPSPTTGPSPTPLLWSNGDVLQMSPRKSRSGIRDRRIRDRPSPLGPNGKTDLLLSHHSTVPDDGTVTKVITENGDLNSCDFQRLVQHHQGHAEQPENELDASLQRPTKRPRTKKSPEDHPVPVHSKGPVEVVLVEEDGDEEVEQAENSNASRSPLCAPLGIPFCSASVGGARNRPLPLVSSSNFPSSSDSGGLPDIETLRKRMEHIAGVQGLEGVSTDCANLLNNGLDAYLKRLIRSCFELVGSRSGHEPTRPPAYKQQPQGKVTNGMWPGHQMQTPSSSGAMEAVQESRAPCQISLLDFKVAMELNPQQLGEDWPVLLEKISLHSSEE